MSYSQTGLIGASLVNGTTNVDIRTAAQVAAGNQPFRDGTTTWGPDGRKYVYGKTSAAVSNNARVDFVFSTRLITPAASGALINLNGQTIESGGAGWFAAVQNYTAGTGITTAAPPG
jgi:hypothetical protein